MNAKKSEKIQLIHEPRRNEGLDKVSGLPEAIKRYIQPAMKIHLGYEANAATSEIIRQFWATKPEFTLIMGGISGTFALGMIHGGLVKKLVFTSGAEWYPKPGVNAVIQRAYRDGLIEMENWSVLSLVQRLVAGALGIGFMPTKSIIGSSIAKDNRKSFKLIEDPFQKGKKIGVVQALNPDISIIHGWVADPYGNTIIAPSSLTYFWGTKASKGGAIVTVEKIVTTDFIREHSDLVKIPGYMVKSVSVVPLGAHPQGLNNQGLPEFEAYEQDIDFISELGGASKDTEMFNTWISNWVLDCNTHDNYLAKLGSNRVRSLKNRTKIDDFQKNEMKSAQEQIQAIGEYSPTEMMVIATSRKVRKKISVKNYKTLFAGIGIALLAGSLAYYQLLEDGFEIDLVGAGTIGFSPLPGHLLSNDLNTLSTAKMLVDQLDLQGVCVGGKYNVCLGILGAAQVDRFGNINSTKTAKGTYLGGSGGANDIASGAQEVIVVTKQSPERFKMFVDYVTCPGSRVKTVVSNLGIFEKFGTNCDLALTEYFPSPKMSARESIQNIKDKCGWDLRTARYVKKVATPTLKELLTLRELDPTGEFLGK